MEEQEKKQGKLSYAERMAMALQSMKGKPLPTDFDEWETPLRADILEKLHERREKPGEN